MKSQLYTSEWTHSDLFDKGKLGDRSEVTVCLNPQSHRNWDSIYIISKYHQKEFFQTKKYLK